MYKGCLLQLKKNQFSNLPYQTFHYNGKCPLCRFPVLTFFIQCRCLLSWFFFVYFVQNKPSNLPFISLMLWVEVNLGIFPYKRRNQINIFPIKLMAVFCLFVFFLTFLNSEHSSESIQQLLRHSTQFSWSICSWVNTYMVLLWEIKSSREPLFIILHC